MVSNVTQARREEEAFEHVHALLRVALEQSPVGILIADAPDVYVRVANAAALEVPGPRPGPLIGDTAEAVSESWPCFRPDGTPFTLEETPLVRAIQRGEISRNVEMRIRRLDGEDRWVLATAAPVRDAQGRIVAGVAIFPDVTERKNAELALAAALARQRLISRITTTALGTEPERMQGWVRTVLAQLGTHYAVDHVDLRCFDGARRAAPILHQWQREPLELPRRFVEGDLPSIWSRALEGETVAIHGLDDLPPSARAERDVLRAVGAGSVLALPLSLRGSTAGVLLLVSKAPRDWSDDTASTLRLAGAVLTHTISRGQVEAALRKREADLARAQRAAGVGTYVLDWRTGEVTPSDELCALFGYTRDEASVDLWRSRIHPEDRDRVGRALDTVVAAGDSFEQEYRVHRLDGALRHVRDHADIERSADGTPLRAIGTLTDITRHKETEEALRHANAEIRRLKDRAEAENVYLREEVRASRGVDRIVGASAAMERCLHLVAQVAPTDATVLVLGETGVGKELIAHAIHDASRRSAGPLVSVNCGALPATLIESELFGHEKGAFTGAAARRRGRFELADGGTLLLDEIGDLPLELQTKLLRVLQDGAFERLGGAETIRADVRVIAATNRDLDEAVAQGAFREDLYYRISAFPIRLPPLRERREDVPRLAKHFVAKHARRLDREVASISADMLARLTAYTWPGNVRELESVIQRALITSAGPTLELAEELQPVAAARTRQRARDRGSPASLRDIEREHIRDVLTRAAWLIEGPRGAATLLGLAPSTLRSKMRRLGITRLR